MSARTIGLWVLKLVASAFFLYAASLKLASQPNMVAEFGTIGFGQNFRLLTGAIEVIGVALLLWPRTTLYGVGILLCVCAGAFAAQIGPLHGDIIHVLACIAALLGIGWLARGANTTTG